MSRRPNKQSDDPVTERDPETQGSEVAVETEDQANQPGAWRGPCCCSVTSGACSAARTSAARKVRWMLGLLRPYRLQVAGMVVALLIATAGGARPAVPRRARRSTTAYEPRTRVR